jgi:serine/threonine-protein kinase
LAPWEVASVVRQIAAALSAAHTCNIIHRDLKPENILIVPGAGEGEDVIKVIDFGVSKVERTPRVQSGVGLIGTPHYMAPEQALGPRGHVDSRTDQFALAVITYEMLMREAPFGGDDPLNILYRIVHEETPPVVLKDGAQQPWTPQAVEATLRRALAKDPTVRFPTVGEFAAALTDAIAADFGGPPAPLCLFQRTESEARPGKPRSMHLTPEPAPASASTSSGLSHHKPTGYPTRSFPRQPRRRRGPALLFATAAAAAALFYFRADVERALPPSARAQLGAVVGHIAPTIRMLPSLSWGVRAPTAPTAATTSAEAR